MDTSADIYVVPISLVMRRTICFYCSREFVADLHVLNYNYGIRHCEQHRAVAHRDIHAFLHTSGVVHLKDARENDILNALCNYLTLYVSIVRSNGDISSGWQIYNGANIEHHYIRRINGSWSLPMQHNSNITKNVPLDSFRLPQVKVANSAILNTTFYELLEKSLAILEKGLYESEREQQRGKSLATPQETTGVVSIITEDGQHARVLV